MMNADREMGHDESVMHSEKKSWPGRSTTTLVIISYINVFSSCCSSLVACLRACVSVLYVSCVVAPTRRSEKSVCDKFDTTVPFVSFATCNTDYQTNSLFSILFYMIYQ